MGQISNEVVRQLLGKFPSSEAAARKIVTNSSERELFTTYKEGEKTFIVVPKNLESFADNLLLISILKASQILGYEPVVGEKELPVAVLKTNDGDYFAGYVYQSMESSTGPRQKGSSKFWKGCAAFQTKSVEACAGKNRSHLILTDHTPGKKLAAMQCFVKEYWGVRAHISAVFSALPTKPWTCQASYLKPQAQLEAQVVVRRLPFDNGGVYSSEEVAYFRSYFANDIGLVEGFHNSLSTPTDDLASHFWEKYDPCMKAVRRIKDSLNDVFVTRARVLFPVVKQGKKKSKWSSYSLADKLAELAEQGKLEAFMPNKLPGFARLLPTTAAAATTDAHCRQKWRLLANHDELRLRIVESYEALLSLRTEDA